MSAAIVDVLAPVEQEGTKASVKAWLKRVGERVEAGEPIVEPEPVVVATKDDCCGGGSCAGEPIVEPEPVLAVAAGDCCAGGSCAGPVIEQAPASASAQQPGLWSRLMTAIMPSRSA